MDRDVHHGDKGSGNRLSQIRSSSPVRPRAKSREAIRAADPASAFRAGVADERLPVGTPRERMAAKRSEKQHCQEDAAHISG